MRYHDYALASPLPKHLLQPCVLLRWSYPTQVASSSTFVFSFRQVRHYISIIHQKEHPSSTRCIYRHASIKKGEPSSVYYIRASRCPKREADVRHPLAVYDITGSRSVIPRRVEPLCYSASASAGSRPHGKSVTLFGEAGEPLASVFGVKRNPRHRKNNKAGVPFPLLAGGSSITTGLGEAF